MSKRRVKLVVEVDLDWLTGMFNEQEDWADYLQHLLKEVCPHYNPSVRLYNEEDQR